MTAISPSGRRRLAGALVLLLFGGLGTPAGAAADQKETERVERTIPFAAGGTLRLKNFSGEVRVTGTTADQVVITAVRRATRERLDRVKLDIQVSDGLIAIDANRRESAWRNRNNNVVETDFQIEVPARTELDIHAFSSEVRITGVEGRQKLHTFSGGVTVRAAAAPLQIDTFSGEVRLELREDVGNPDLEVKTFSGDITARVAGTASGRIRFSSFSGGLRSDLPMVLETGSRRRLTARLNQGDGSELYFKTFSGDVRITKN
jgi:DUF4097 and DUF4098 domain-containing protein YvlB